MGSNYKITYNVDLVFCIDATASMDNVINIVKRNAINFYSDVIAAMEKKHKVINRMRIRVIAFRDYIADKENAMLSTRFFNLPEENDKLKKTVNSIVAFGGGDEPEDGGRHCRPSLLPHSRQPGQPGPGEHHQGRVLDGQHCH